MIYELKYDYCRFNLDPEKKIVEVYLNGFKEPTITFNELPVGIKWENLELILNHEDKGLKNELGKRLFEMYKNL